MEEKINKPISLEIETLKQQIVSTIASSNIHPTIIRMVLGEVFNSISLEIKQFENSEIKKYEEEMNKNKSKETEASK